MTEEKVTAKLEKFLEEYFKLMELDVAFSVDEEDEVIKVGLKTNGELAGLLIGAKGKNIYSFQRLLNIIFNREEVQKNIVVNIDDWREKEEDRLKELARKTADHVKETGQSQNLYNLSASQRRIIHTFLAEFDGIKTESQGEGDERFLVVSAS